MNPYDEIPYPALCYTQSHPDRLATIATLLGLEPPPIENCRVLEVGCAVGGNIIPMAVSLPTATFLGIDLSGRQIAEGQATIAALGLRNVRLQAMDVRAVDESLGHFDYIIAHGVYSWTPPEAREKLLELYGRSLAANGVAYISYNTYPGWHLLAMVREMMLYYTRYETDPLARVARAHELLEFLTAAVPAERSAYGAFLHQYATMLQEKTAAARWRSDALLLHDELEAVNDPVYFSEFIEQAGRHGLQYLCEADFPAVMPNNFPPEIAKRLLAMSRNVVEMEQYMDFIRNQTFRRTLLCRQEIQIERVLKANPERMEWFYVASRAMPVADAPDIHGPVVEHFRGADGALISTDHPVSKAALAYLAGMSPQAVPFAALLQAARSQVAAGEDKAGEDAAVLAANLLRAYSYSTHLIDLHVYRPPFTIEVSERPVASPLARWQAQSQPTVTNLRHERVNLDEISRALLPYLDGRHGEAALLGGLIAQVEAGTLGVEREDRPVKSTAEARAILGGELALNLRWLGRAALLIQ